MMIRDSNDAGVVQRPDVSNFLTSVGSVFGGARQGLVLPPSLHVAQINPETSALR